MASVGPELPPHLAKRKRSIHDEGDKGSSPPAKIQAASPPKERRVLGPAPPPAPLEERPSQPADQEDDDSSSDEDYGPSLPPVPGSSAAYEAEAKREAAAEQTAYEEAKPSKPQREEWMLLPPTSSDWSSRVDPTKLKNRKFASGRSAKTPTENGSGVSSIWTETPEEKRKRLEDEVLGRKDLSTMQGKSKPKKDDAEAEETARRIREYNERNRGQSLYEEHKKATPKEKEDDPSQRGFDKEKDMALGGRIGHVQKKDMLKRAGDFGSRFERGSFL